VHLSMSANREKFWSWTKFQVVAVNLGVGCELNLKDAYPSWDSHGTSLGESPEFVGISPPSNGQI